MSHPRHWPRQLVRGVASAVGGLPAESGAVVVVGAAAAYGMALQNGLLEPPVARILAIGLGVALGYSVLVHGARWVASVTSRSGQRRDTPTPASPRAAAAHAAGHLLARALTGDAIQGPVRLDRGAGMRLDAAGDALLAEAPSRAPDERVLARLLAGHAARSLLMPDAAAPDAHERRAWEAWARQYLARAADWPWFAAPQDAQEAAANAQTLRDLYRAAHERVVSLLEAHHALLEETTNTLLAEPGEALSVDTAQSLLERVQFAPATPCPSTSASPTVDGDVDARC